jgi:2-hydroxychromene-2-carboxylate isomerase
MYHSFPRRRAAERQSVGQREVTQGHTVEFFFSPGSRYCYLAGSQLPHISSRTGCRFDWRPVRGTEIRLLRDRDPFQGEPVSGQYDWAYRRRDAEMWARYYGVPFREPPSHDFDFDLLARAAAAATRLGTSDSYGWALCSLVYGSDTWPLDREACVTLAEKPGLSRSSFEHALEDPATRDLLTRNAHDAHARGAFGVPTFFLDGVMGGTIASSFLSTR